MSNKEFVKLEREVWDDERLTAIEVLIVAHFKSLAQNKGHSWANADEMMKRCHCSRNTFFKSLKRLKEYGYIWDNGARNQKKNTFVKGVVKSHKNKSAEHEIMPVSDDDLPF